MAKRKPKPAPAEELNQQPAPDAASEPAAPGEDQGQPHEAPASTTGESSHVEAVRPTGPRSPNPFGYKHDVAAGVRLLEDRRFKQVQVKFAAKPSDEVRQVVRDAGFRWLQEEQVWAKQIDPEKGWQTRADADALFEQVTAMIRAEQGLTHERA